MRAVLVGCMLAGCVPESSEDARPLILVSVVPQRFVVQHLAEDLVRIEVMIPPGASPATYEPTLRQLKAVDEAALYVQLGHPKLPFEATWLEGILREAPDLRVVNASQGLPVRDEDPHLWLVPRYVEHMAVRMAGALGKVLPEDQAVLQRNLEAFRRLTRTVDRDVREQLAAHEGGEFFVFHPAWGHFAQEYGLRQVAIEGERKQPGPHALAVLLEHARRSRVKVIFAQPQFDPTSAEIVARETGARIEVLDPLAEDWDANLRRVAERLAEVLSQ